MFLLEFGVVHEGCVVNELSRALPNDRFICPGGFILNEHSADEIIALDGPTDADVEAVQPFLQSSGSIAESSLVERTPGRAFVHLRSSTAPAVGYCSQAVERNPCFRIGHEIQHKGVEQWRVGCRDRSNAEGLIEDLKEWGTFGITKHRGELGGVDRLSPVRRQDTRISRRRSVTISSSPSRRFTGTTAIPPSGPASAR